MKYILSLITFLILFVNPINAQEKQIMQLPDEVRDNFRNFGSGSCVQCSIGLVGVQLNNANAASLLWDSIYGKAEIGGSTPSRVAAYAKKRGLAIYNVTGDEFPYVWHDWAVKTGRFAAIGAGSSHFQTLYGKDFKTNTYYVCNNNSPHRVDEYTENGYSRLHEASGQWIVILKQQSTPEHPQYVNWWK